MLSFARKSLERLRNSNADNLQSANLGARWLGDFGVLYPICTQFIFDLVNYLHLFPVYLGRKKSSQHLFSCERFRGVELPLVF